MDKKTRLDTQAFYVTLVILRTKMKKTKLTNNLPTTLLILGISLNKTIEIPCQMQSLIVGVIVGVVRFEPTQPKHQIYPDSYRDPTLQR